MKTMKTAKAKLATTAQMAKEPTKLYKTIVETPNSYEVMVLPLKVTTVKRIKEQVTTTMEFKARIKNALYLKTLELGMINVIQVVAFFKGGIKNA